MTSETTIVEPTERHVSSSSCSLSAVPLQAALAAEQHRATWLPGAPGDGVGTSGVQGLRPPQPLSGSWYPRSGVSDQRCEQPKETTRAEGMLESQSREGWLEG